MNCRNLIILMFFIISPFQIIFAQTANSDQDILHAQIAAKEEEIKKLEAEEAQYKQVLSGKQTQGKTLKNQIAVINLQIKQLKANLKFIQVKISRADKNIKLLSEKIAAKAKEIQTRQNEIASSIRFLARSESESLLALLLESNKFSDFLSQNQYLADLHSGLYTSLQILAQNKAEYEGLLKDENNTKLELSGLKKELTVKDRLVEDQKKEKDSLLKETQNQEAIYQKMISQVQVRQAEIQREIFELEEKLRGQIKGVPSAHSGVLAWPLTGRITQGYGPTSVTGFYNDAYKFHNGIDIADYYGAPIGAAFDGIVSAVGDDGKYAYGKWIAIRHNNGLTTLYAHLAENDVSIGQSVNQGQIIGYEGSTGFVTGPHLHFTVYSTNTFQVKNQWFGPLPLGGTVNPLNYL